MVKKATGAAPAKKAAAAPSHPSYRDMIKEAILNLKERNGSSRQALKKYILANNKALASSSQAVFDGQFNKALRTGVEKGDFTQPKGTSGPVKLAKKEPAPKKATSPTATTKKTSEAKPKKTAAPKKTTTTKTKTTTTAKKVPAAKKEKVAKPKANTSTKRKGSTATTTPAPAPAVVDVPKVLGKTKSGRVTKTPAKAAPKKTAAKKEKTTTTKKATPKKAAAVTATPAAA